MTFDYNLGALISYLKENKLQPELQKESGQVYILYKMNGFEVPVFFLLPPEGGLLQIVAYLPYQLSEIFLGEAARMLHFLNKQLDLPGFGMDETEKLMFYRSVLPCLEGKIDKYRFNIHLGTTRVACETFMQAIGAVVSGNVKIEEVMKQ